MDVEPSLINGPEGGGGSGVFSQVRACGGGNQGSAPQPLPQDKSILHQGTHIPAQLAHSHFSAPHARQQNVPPPTASIYHVPPQMRAATQSRNHATLQQARMMLPTFYSESALNPQMYSMYSSQVMPIFPVNTIPPPQTESGNPQRGVQISVQTPPSFQWNSRSQLVMSQPPSYPPNYFTSVYNPAPPSTPSMVQPPHTQQQQSMLPQVGGANINQGSNSGLMLAAAGNAAAANQGNQMGKAKIKRPNAIKIIDPITLEEVKTDEQESNADHQQEESSKKESSVQGSGKVEFALKVALVAAEDSPSRHEVEPQPTTTPPQPVINGPSEVDTGKRTGTPVVSALTNSSPLEFTQKRSSSRTIVEGRGSGSPGRSSKTTSVPQTNLVKSAPMQQAPSQSPAPPSQMPILQQVQQPISAPTPQQTSQLAASLLMMPPMVKPQAAQPVLQSPPPEEPPQQVQQSEHHPPPKQQRKPREEKKSPPVIVQVEEKRQPTPPLPPSLEELAAPAPVVPPSNTPPPTPLLATPLPTAPPPLPQLSAFASNLQITSLKATAKAAHSAVAASIPNVEEKQQTTETPQEQPTVKASQRNKNKKNQKSREINQKGLEKEGTDMDSMVDTAKAEDVTQNREPSPVGKQAPIEAEVLPIEVLPVSVTPPLTESTKLQEEDDEKDANDMVTAKNEENTLLSMQNSSDEVIESQVIVRSSSPPLKFDYKEDQWSPKNPTGKKVYDREFLLKLKNEPLSSKKPDNMQFDLEIFLKEKDVTVNNNNNTNNPLRNTRFSSSYSMTGARSGNGFVPDFVRSSSSQTRTVSKRNSQQSRPGGISSGRGSKGIYNSLSLRDDFKLNQVENAWKPVKLSKHIDVKSKEEQDTEDLYKKVRGILNKLTPQKFDVLVGQFRRLPINNHERLSGVIRLVFEKAVDEPAFSLAYAELCKVLAKIEVKTESEDGTTTQSNNFRKLLITRCQTEFEANKKAEMDFEKKQQEINETKDPDKRKELQFNFNEEERKIRMKSVGLVRFIGELYKLKMLTANIMHGCIRQLLEKIDEESLECLCKLLTTIGKELETTSMQNDRGSEWNEYFNRMAKLSRKNDQGSKISSRVRFMLQDVIELRGNKWVPRRDENKPKTMAQIQEEVEKESEKAALMVNAPRSGYKDDRRSEPRRNNQRGNNQCEEGWSIVSKPNNFRSNYPPEVSKIQTLKTTAAMDMGNSNLTSLGSSTVFSHWVRGASSKQNSNTFAVLNDDMKPSSNARSLKPSASIERERALSGVKEMFPVDRSNERSSRDNNRGRSVSQHSPSPSLSGPVASSPQVQTQQPKKPEPSKTEPVAKSPPTPPTPLDQEKISLRTDELMSEFIYNSNLKESLESVKELVDGSDSQIFINCAINKILEMRKTDVRIKMGELMGELLKNQVITVEVFSQEMKDVFDCAEDLEIDMPHVWHYIGEIFGPIIAKEVMGFDNLKIVSRSVSSDNYKSLESTLNEIFKILIVDKGPVWIKEQWDSSKVQLPDFLPESSTKPFLEKYPFLEGNKVKVDDSNIPYEKVEEKLISFLKHNKDNTVDHVFDWLTTNVGKRTNDPLFIGALTKAVITASSSLDSKKLDKDLLHRNMILMKRYVDNNEELELRCLYTVQNLVVTTLESPSGMLIDIFKELNESSVISNEGFQKWRNPDREEMAWELNGKGVALVTLNNFFAALDDDAADELDDDAS